MTKQSFAFTVTVMLRQIIEYSIICRSVTVTVHSGRNVDEEDGYF
jgi:hypothetical protein